MKKIEIATTDLVYAGTYMRAFKAVTLKGKIGYRFAKLLRKINAEIKIWEDEGRKPSFEKFAVEMTEETVNEYNRLKRPGDSAVEIGALYIPQGTKIAQEYEKEILPKLEDNVVIECMAMPLPEFINALGRWPETFWYDALWFLWEDEEDLPEDFVPEFEKPKEAPKK